jgi:hypothetical protein
LPRIRELGQCNFRFRPVFNHKIAMKQALLLLSAMGDMRFLSRSKILGNSWNEFDADALTTFSCVS